jgi:hypothetical protein
MSTLLEQASLVMIPSGYKEDVVYSQIPTNGNGDLSFTRASNGTRVNSAGLVEVVPWNFVTYSEQIDNPAWAKEAGNSIIADTTTAPNGTLTADTISVASSFNMNTYEIVSTNDGIHTYSVYLKKNVTNLISLYIYQTFGASGFKALGEINFDNGTFTVSVGTGTIESVGNGWFRLTLTATLLSGANSFGFYTSSTTGTRTVYAWGAQVNIGSTAKPYFPTTDRANVPRLTYQNGGGGCPSLLLEKQSTNLVTYSEQFDNAGWLKFNGAGGSAPVVTPNYALSPDGTMNADRVQLARTTQTFSYSEIKQDFGTTGTQYTVSVYLKSLSGNPTISMANDGATFNFLATLTSEWVRYTATFTASGTPSAELILYEQVTSSSLTADFLVWGFQAEASSYPTSYIPTTSSSATRVADACFKTGISSLIGQTSGTAFVDFVYLGGVQAIVMELANSAANDLINVYITSSATTQCYMFDGGSQVGFINSSHTFVQGSRYKIAIGYASNDLVLYINGTQIGTATPSSIAATSEIYISRDKAALYLTDTKYNEVVIFPTRLTNAELASLTTI